MKILRGFLIIMGIFSIVMGALFKILHWVFAEYVTGTNLMALGSFFILVWLILIPIERKNNPDE